MAFTAKVTVIGVAALAAAGVRAAQDWVTLGASFYSAPQPSAAAFDSSPATAPAGVTPGVLAEASAATAGAAGPRSAYLSAAIKAGLPMYLPPVPVEKLQIVTPFAVALPAAPDAALVRMEKVEVRAEPIPSEEQVLTDLGKASLAMPQYLGDPDGLDRGFLNRFTIEDLWRQVPLLGRFPLAGSMTNEDRALMLAAQEERLSLRDYFKTLLQLGRPPKDRATLKELEQEDQALRP